MTITKKNLVSGLSAAALALGLSFGAAQAQQAAPEVQMEAPAAAPQVDDEKLRSFAVAFLEVAKVNQTYRPRIEAAGTPEEQQRLEEEAGGQMIEVVNEADGITVDEYNMIIQAAQTDPELAQRINGHITEAVNGPAEQ